MQFHQVEDQDITHSVQVQWMLEKLEQHLEHDKEPATQTHYQGQKKCNFTHSPNLEWNITDSIRSLGRGSKGSMCK